MYKRDKPTNYRKALRTFLFLKERHGLKGLCSEGVSGKESGPELRPMGRGGTGVHGDKRALLGSADLLTFMA